MRDPLSRRSFLTGVLASATSAQLLGAARALGLAPNAELCTLKAEQEVGPYYIAHELLRSDIVESRAGIPLSLRIAVLDSRTCQPIPNVAVDIWHCDALGLYSGFTQQNPTGPGGPGGGPGGPGSPEGMGPGPGAPPPPDFDPQHPGNHPGPPHGFGPPPENHPTDKLTFLRGIQLTDAKGSVRFTTIFPGFYMGRTNHIHFKVRLGGHAAGHTYEGGHISHVGQVFFPESVAAGLMSQPPYSKHQIHRTTQAEDGVFNGQAGARSIARLATGSEAGSPARMHADLIAAVDPTATPAPAQRIGGPGAPGGPPGPGL